MENSRIAALLAPFLAGAALADAQLSQLSTYLDLLLHWNARINLTAVRDPEQIVTRHFGESLFAARSLYPHNRSLATDHWLLDFGSGAGFPGLPIKIWAPALRLTLIESQYRKAIFLREVIRSLALRAADVLPSRAEGFDLGTRHSSIGNRQSAIDNSLAAVTVTLRAVERFEKVLPTAARLLAAAPAADARLALLIGDAQVSRARQLVPALTWSDPIPIPQSSHRVLLIGAQLDRRSFATS